MEIHPLADIFPSLPLEDFSKLVASIKENGLRFPITTYENKILDGRNRFAACKTAGVAPRFEPYKGDNPVAYVMDANLHRRHLSPTQVAMVGARLANLGRGQPSKSNRPIGLLSQEEVAELTGSTVRSIKRAKQVLASGDKDLIDAADKDKIAISKAAEIAKLPEEQRKKRIKEEKKHSKQTHVSHNSGENEWYTPENFIKAARSVMGEIDLDPASSDEANKIVGATKFYTEEEDGLSKKWSGRIWLNPPYSQPEIGKFAEKLLASKAEQALLLVNNATETAWFQSLAAEASVVCFPKGRVKFWSPRGVVAAPLQGQAVLYFGDQVVAFVKAFRSFGVVWLKSE